VGVQARSARWRAHRSCIFLADRHGYFGNLAASVRERLRDAPGDTR
jgi:hypothetical protein